MTISTPPSAFGSLSESELSTESSVLQTSALEAAIRDESNYDRVTSGLMAAIIGTAAIVTLLGLVYLVNIAEAEPEEAPIRIIEVGTGGGRPEGERDSSEKIDIPDAAADVLASNNILDASDFEEPSLQMNPSAMLEAITEVEFADLAEEMLDGETIATGIRSSKLGTGAVAYGFGGGDGSIPREERWSILYAQGQTLDEYARQLDFFGVEMGTVRDGTLYYVANFSQARPTVRSTGQGNDDRLYFLWQGGGRQAEDIQLLRKGGVEVGARGAIFQFYPRPIEQELLQLEQAHAGLQPSEIRYTRFQVIPQGGNRYTFQVIDQQPLN